MARYFLQLSYDGTDFHGWQIQPNATSVQATLNDALSLYLRENICCYGAGRTDTGVHASFFVAQFDSLNDDLENNKEKHLYKINSILPQSVAIQSIKKVHDDASARFDAISRTYKYYLHRAKTPFRQRFSTRLTSNIDIDLMNSAAAKLLEYEDFTSLSKFSEDVKTNLCTISHARWITADDQIIFTITANRFLRNMVRATVGMLLDVGKGKIFIDDFCKIIEAKDRNISYTSAPAQGLFLTDIKYPYDI